jgi:hypothetical protein
VTLIVADGYPVGVDNGVAPFSPRLLSSPRERVKELALSIEL